MLCKKIKKQPALRLIIITSLFSATFLLIFNSFNPKRIIFNRNILRTEFPTQSEMFAIKTEGCVIPAMDPFDESVKKFVNYPKKIKPCRNANYSILEQNKTHIWVSNNDKNLMKYNVTERKTLSCCYRSFFCPNNVDDIYSKEIDHRIKYNDCINFTEIIKRGVNDEYVRVTCYFGQKKVYDQFFLSAPNKTLPKEISKGKPGYNVLILGIDNVSRLNFHRTMPRTLAFLKKKKAVELMGYNKIGENSYPNIVALLMGHKESELKKMCHPLTSSTYDDCPFIWHWYKEAGFYTAFGEDTSSLATFNYLRSGFRGTPVDYYAHPFIRQADEHVGNNKDGYSSLCMNEHFFYQILLNYVENITETLSNSKMFGFFWATSISHDDLNYPMVMDESYEKFFQRLDAAKYLEKSVIFLISDHGIRWGEIRSTEQGYFEERLPFVYVLTPQSFRNHYSLAYYNLIYNSRQLTTPFDIHETLFDLIEMENIENGKMYDTVEQKTYNRNADQKGVSLFLPIASNRTCKMASIDDHWCACFQWESITLKNKSKSDGGGELIKYINGLLNEKGVKVCAELALKEIVNIKQLKNRYNNSSVKWNEYLIVVKAVPGNGLFEANMRLLGRKWSVVGSVSRLNRYDDQSRCVDDPVLKNYCFCA